MTYHWNLISVWCLRNVIHFITWISARNECYICVFQAFENNKICKHLFCLYYSKFVTLVRVNGRLHYKNSQPRKNGLNVRLCVPKIFSLQQFSAGVWCANVFILRDASNFCNLRKRCTKPHPQVSDKVVWLFSIQINHRCWN